MDRLTPEQRLDAKRIATEQENHRKRLGYNAPSPMASALLESEADLAEALDALVESAHASERMHAAMISIFDTECTFVINDIRAAAQTARAILAKHGGSQ